MRSIDQYAYANRLHLVDPAKKAGLALLTLLLCFVLDRPAVGILSTLWMWGLATYWARLPGGTVARILLAEGTFLALTTVGVAVSIGLAEPASLLWRWRLGALWLASGPAQLDLAVRLASRALGCAAALNFLALTTPLVDLVDLLRRLRVPTLLVDLMTLIYRFIFSLLESLERMRTAQDCRLGYCAFRQGVRSAGLLGGRLFIDAYQRSRRLETALQGRGYSGELRVLPLVYRQDRRVYVLSAGIAASLLLARVLL